MNTDEITEASALYPDVIGSVEEDQSAANETKCIRALEHVKPPAL